MYDRREPPRPLRDPPPPTPRRSPPPPEPPRRPSPSPPPSPPPDRHRRCSRTPVPNLPLIKIAKPDEFHGVLKDIIKFLYQCNLYLQLEPYTDRQEVVFAMSYMKSGSAL